MLSVQRDQKSSLFMGICAGMLNGIGQKFIDDQTYFHHYFQGKTDITGVNFYRSVFTIHLINELRKIPDIGFKIDLFKIIAFIQNIMDHCHRFYAQLAFLQHFSALRLTLLLHLHHLQTDQRRRFIQVVLDAVVYLFE